MKVILKTDYEKYVKGFDLTMGFRNIRFGHLYRDVVSTQYKNGFPYFTFYIDGVWTTKSAKYFMPVKY